MSESFTGARVMFCGHAGWFVADIHKIAGACLVRASAPVTPGNIVRGRDNEATHHMVDAPEPCYWNPQLGVFCCPAKQVRKL
jgi:hypothetical protein